MEDSHLKAEKEQRSAISVLTGMPSLWPASVDWFDITLDSAVRNLALDEVLLQTVEENPTRGVLRTWHPDSHVVVVGRSNEISSEVNEEECRAQRVPILRRSTGGGAVLIGPGCLAYALALPLTAELRASGVVAVTQQVMEAIASRLRTIIRDVEVCGTSDLVVQGRKFSGNSQRWLRQAFLHHGTILYDFALPRIGQLLRPPTRQPDYRQQRTHEEFVTNVSVARQELINVLVAAWRGIAATCHQETLLQSHRLAESRYASTEWTENRYTSHGGH